MLTHPLRRLSLCWTPFLILAFLASLDVGVRGLPKPVGPVSDYGSVLDRHGREDILARIEQAKAKYGIDVWILASWDDPFDQVDRYASAVLQAWGLGQGKTLLAVFVKTKQDWSVSIVAGQATASAHPDLAATLRNGVASLVSHRRIQEAMTQLFVLLDRALAPTPIPRPRGPSGNVGRFIFVALGVGAAFGLMVLALRRICPRCGRILRLGKRHSVSTYGRRVYFCRRCGYTRAKGGEG